MQVKKFEARTMKDALEMVKTELGPEAIILSAKDNTGGFGLLGQNSVEITAAVSERTLKKRQIALAKLNNENKDRFKSSSAKAQKKYINSVLERMTNEQSAKMPRTRTQYVDIQDEEMFEAQAGATQPVNSQALQGANSRLAMAMKRATQPAQSSAGAARAIGHHRYGQPAAPVASPFATPQGGVAMAAAQTMAPAQALAEQMPADRLQLIQGEAQPAQPAKPRGVSLEKHLEEVAALKGEISRLKSVVNDFQKVPQTFISVHPGAEKGVSYEFSFIYDKLRSVGVDDEGILTLIEEAKKSLTPDQYKNKNLIDAFVAKRILEKTTVTDDPYSSRIHVFAGASGHGKTTSLVKFASHLVVEKGKSVAILTADTLKVGAADQLKIYAQILNVPFAVVRNQSDWNYLNNELKDYDYLLLDFPALSMGGMEDVNLAYKLLPPKEVERRVHLVVSATSKLSHVLELGRRYQSLDVKDVIFTGVDQAVNHGLIFNFQRQLRVPLHSFSIGSKIPEDYEMATRERVLDLLFKLTKLSRKRGA